MNDYDVMGAQLPPLPGDPRRLGQAFREWMAERHGDPFLFSDGLTETPFGQVEKLTVGRRDGATMTWADIQTRFEAARPGKYAVQVHPPASSRIDRVNNYHLWVMPESFPMQFLDLRGYDARCKQGTA